MREQSQTQKTEDILGEQERARLRDGLDPELIKRGEEIVDFFHMKGENLDIDELEKKHKILSRYIFQAAHKRGYIMLKIPFQESNYVSEMTLSKEAKIQRQIQNLQEIIKQKDRKILSLEKELKNA